jgi:DNA-binding NtrC family response regulator
MPGNLLTGTSVLCFGLDETLESELVSVLLSHHQEVCLEPHSSVSECLYKIDSLGVRLVFSTSNPKRYNELLRAIRHRKPGLPVVVVSRHPDVSGWLDALEAGAADYCAAPFEFRHIQWILESYLPFRRAAAASAG